MSTATCRLARHDLQDECRRKATSHLLLGDATTWAEQYNAGVADWVNDYGREMGDAAAAEQVCWTAWMLCVSKTTVFPQPYKKEAVTVSCACLSPL